MEFLTVEEVIAASAADIGNPTREEKMIFGSWVWRAESQIKSYELSQKTDALTVFDLVARKPVNFIKTIDISLVDNEGNDVQYEYRGNKKRIHPITSINSPVLIDIYEDEHCFHLSSNGSNIDCIHVRYESFPLSEDGDLLIPSSHIEAISRYIKYMHAERSGAPESKITRYQREWHMQARKARGKNSLPSSLEARELLQKWMTLIPDGNNLKFNTY